MTTHHKSYRTNGGFTLLELLVVLAIAGLLVSLVPPLVSAAVPGTTTKSAVRELAVSLRDARNAAISRGHAINVVIDLDDAGYRTGNGPYNSLPNGIIIELAGGLADDTYDLIFYPDGSSSGASVRVGRDDAFYEVSVGWLMGGVTVSRLPSRDL